MLTINEYIEQHSSQEPDYLQVINRDTNLHVLNAHMLSGHIQGRLLAMMSRMICPTYILELGTYTGYSALCLAEGLHADGHLFTIERNDELQDTIQRNLGLSPLGSRITSLIGEAQTYLTAENSSLPTFFDLVFIDADKREYCDYIDLVYSRVRAGGWILADNTLWDGHVVDSAYDKDAQTLGLRAFNDYIAHDERLEKVILPFRDGLTIIRKK
ncbi:MAG: O-methyltransferase [Paludibacteraceae bacterium]|nr:O-methyltransferase [Paludibacteraceae bacterium]